MKSLAKGLNLLKLFLSGKLDMTLAEISELSGLNKSSACRIASVLVKNGYLAQAKKGGSYSLGLIYMNFAKLINNRLRVRSIALPYLIELNKMVKESVIIAYKNDWTQDVYTETVQDITLSSHALRVIPEDGTGMSLYSTCLGKIILAYMSNKELQDYFRKTKITHFTPNTITTIDAMKKHLLTVRKEGVAFDNEEFSLGIRGLATRLIDYEEKIVGSMGITAPSSRLNKDKMRELTPTLKRYALKISREIGFKGLKQ